MPTPSPRIQPEALNPPVKYRAIVRFIPYSPFIEGIQYDLSYERSNELALLRTTHRALHFRAALRPRANAMRAWNVRTCCGSDAGSERKPRLFAPARSLPTAAARAGARRYSMNWTKRDPFTS